MANKRSKTVDTIIREMFAKMAQAAARKAIKKIEWDNFDAAEKAAEWAEIWYDRAGAEASRWYRP